MIFERWKNAVRFVVFSMGQQAKSQKNQNNSTLVFSRTFACAVRDYSISLKCSYQSTSIDSNSLNVHLLDAGDIHGCHCLPYSSSKKKR